MAQKKSTILIVDDNEVNILILKRPLLKNGFNIIACNSGKEALDIVSNEKPDLVLLDIMMPRMDGFEVLRRLKSNDDVSNIPVIFQTAKAEDDDKIKGLNMGAVDYITKPYEIKEVIARVNTHLKNKLFLRDEKIVVLDSSSVYSEMILTTLSEIYDFVKVSSTSDELLKNLEAQHFDLAVIDLEMLDSLGDGFIENVILKIPLLKIAVTSSQNIEAYLPLIRKYSICHVVPKPFRLNELKKAVYSILTGEKVFGLENYLETDRVNLKRWEITSKDTLKASLDDIGNYYENELKKVGVNIDFVLNATQKLLDNAVTYGSVSDNVGKEVLVHLGFDSEKIGLSVLDRGGELTKDKIFDNFFSNHESKRSATGLKTVRKLSDRVIINVKEGKKTEIIVLFYLISDKNDVKPIYINII